MKENLRLVVNTVENVLLQDSLGMEMKIFVRRQNDLENHPEGSFANIL